MPGDINPKKIKKNIEVFFEKMEEKIELNEISFKEGVVFANLKSENPQFLIGEKGKTLFYLQYLLKRILIKELNEIFYLDLDINDYKKKKIDYLLGLANKIADEVALTKKEKEFSPMLPYERRIIHLEIAKRNDVISISIGEGPERRVVIKPK